MKTLVVLAVMVAATAHQAYGIPVPGTLSHGTHAYGYGQAPYVGPLASSVPAGIGGKVIPVSDTYEVAAAREQFFRAYQDQLNTIYAIRASRPAYHNTYGYGHHGSAGAVHVSHGTHSSYGTPAVHAPVVHTSHAVHAPAVHTSHVVHAAPAVHHEY
ncbi:cuticle protein CP1876-like [Scylla paramamosain]|uniref:cuticle protein CP1876-like n=1 Tax=Scylla paramamosain TaxID=85552 RepID=UPI003083E63F